jgi:hypothetical protein
MTKNIVKSLTPSIAAGGHRGRGCLFHWSFFNVICFLCKHYNVFSPYFLFKSRYFKSKPVNVPKITIVLDHGYHPDYLIEKLKLVYPQIMTKIRFELSTKPSKQQKTAQGKTGFVPARARWVIERSNAWMERCKSLVKNFERTLSHATTKLNLCFVRLMLKRLSASS